MRAVSSLVALCLCVAVLAGQAIGPRPEKQTPEGRAVAFLAREVPAWSRDNRCYSCHNNGDAARALMAATRLRLPVPAGALEDTAAWLTRPERWDANGGDQAFSDKDLARLQFAAALADAVDTGLIPDRKPLLQAAELVTSSQARDGSWSIDVLSDVGSPATYGRCLATAMACRVLRRADPEKHRDALARADRWLRQAPVKSVLDAAAVLLALQDSDDAGARAQRDRCLMLIRQGQRDGGGWGPYVKSAAEPFDTAVVLLALVRHSSRPEVAALLKKGRAYLVREQQPDGSWPETTRPAGAESYAQRLSTTGWATLALLATR